MRRFALARHLMALANLQPVSSSVRCGLSFEVQQLRFCAITSTYHMIYRSALCRERLRELLFETSVEGALAELDAFCELHERNPALLNRLRPLTAMERVDIMLKEMDVWYFACRAPSRVNLSEPWHWFPRARSMRRQFVFHSGPTNSGKTHQALTALMKASSGLYCAPLKALASQVCENINRGGVPCDLLIGDERQFAGCAEHVSCTMEMAPIDFQVDIAVIDEIQLIGDGDRGWAWTRGILGIPAREIHVCGEARTLPLLKELLVKTGEVKRLRVVGHERLVPLTVTESLQGNLRHVENGDCIVCFSKKSVFDFRARLMHLPDVVPHVVYGALPFAVREQQSSGFNEGVLKASETGIKHVLVSTDAIAYGLNMNVKRIIFGSVKKFDGIGLVELPQASLLQIAGRAGRFGLEFSKHGYATALYDRDLPAVRRAFETPLPPLLSAGMLPNAEVLQVYYELLRRRGICVDKLSTVLERFTEKIKVSGLFFLCDMSRSLLVISRVLDEVPELTVRDKITFCFVPLSDTRHESIELLRKWAEGHARGGPVALGLSLEANHLKDLAWLEWAYRVCEAYCWLSWRFRSTFSEQILGQTVKKNVASAIQLVLAGSG